MRVPLATLHLHLLVAEAQEGLGLPVAAPGDEDVARILARVLSQAKKDWAELEAAWPEDDFEELQQCAVQERLGLARSPRDSQPASVDHRLVSTRRVFRLRQLRALWRHAFPSAVLTALDE